MSEKSIPRSILSALVLGLALVLGGVAAVPAQAVTTTTIATGLGSLENVVTLPDGSFAVSNTGTQQIQRITRDGQVSVLTGARDPGGLVVIGDRLLFAEGNNAQQALTGQTVGAIRSYDLTTGAVGTVVSGISAPNGLTAGGDGTLAWTTTLGPRWGVWTWRDGTLRRLNHTVSGPNGITTAPDGPLWVTSYLGVTVEKVDWGTGRATSSGAWTALTDDLAATSDGHLWVASSSGIVYRLDPAHGEGRIHATVGGTPSSVKVAGSQLVVVTLGGSVLLLDR